MAKILLAEDDQFLREMYSELLKDEGYEIDTAEDGAVAYQKMKQGGWDLVLLDIIMPKMNGLDVAKALINDPATKTIKAVVFLTNLDKGAEIKEALQYGKGYLIKSQITPGDFLSEVKLYLSNQYQTPTTS